MPGSAAAGAAAYVEQLLSALDEEPPRIWAGPDGWIELSPWERQAWAERVDRWRAAYDRLLAGDGSATDDDRRLAFEHACEGTYGDPVHGGNGDATAWTTIEFPVPLHPPHR